MGRARKGQPFHLSLDSVSRTCAAHGLETAFWEISPGRRYVNQIARHEDAPETLCILNSDG